MHRAYLYLTLIACLISFLTPPSVSAQKVLQLEKRNSAKTVKYYIGDDLTYKIEGDKQWKKNEILKITVRDNTITVANGVFHIDQITAILPPNADNIRAYLMKLFGGFGLTVLLYSVGELLVVSSYNWLAFYVGITAVGIAAVSYFAVPWIMQKKMGKKYRLRLLDLSFQ